MRLLLTTIIYCYCATAGEIIIKIPTGINLEKKDVRAYLPKAIDANTAYDRIEIVIYYFSQGVEKFSFTDNNVMLKSLRKGEIRSLVKIKKNKYLMKELFVNAKGANTEQILSNFAQAIVNTPRLQ